MTFNLFEISETATEKFSPNFSINFSIKKAICNVLSSLSPEASIPLFRFQITKEQNVWQLFSPG